MNGGKDIDYPVDDVMSPDEEVSRMIMENDELLHYTKRGIRVLQKRLANHELKKVRIIRDLEKAIHTRWECEEELLRLKKRLSELKKLKKFAKLKEVKNKW